MEYRYYGKSFVIRLDKGEEILSSLKSLCEKEYIRLAKVSGLGAVGKATLGFLNTETKKYVGRTFEGMYEIASLVGNITEKGGEPYLHLHAAIGNTETGEFYGGHLSEAVISVTGEFFIEPIDGEVGRVFSADAGLNIMKF